MLKNGELTVSWVMTVAQAAILAVAVQWFYPRVILSTSREWWVVVGQAHVVLLACLCGWAGWRVVRRHASRAWGAAVAGGVTAAAPYGFILGLAFVVRSASPERLNYQSKFTASAFGVAVFIVAAAAGCGLVGGILASLWGRRHAT